MHYVFWQLARWAIATIIYTCVDSICHFPCTIFGFSDCSPLSFLNAPIELLPFSDPESMDILLHLLLNLGWLVPWQVTSLQLIVAISAAVAAVVLSYILEPSYSLSPSSLACSFQHKLQTLLISRVDLSHPSDFCPFYSKKGDIGQDDLCSVHCLLLQLRHTIPHAWAQQQ